MTIDEFGKHVALRRLEPGRRPVVDWCGRAWHVMGMPDEAYARGRFVTIRPVGPAGGDGAKLMSIDAAHGLLPEGLDVEDVS